mmetsp:Transcript_14036/g.32510  ORF Transcript_14036/g.32510 Transcript_14036/m.32510 type:complete len:97 (+) Transcript_14036:55-345(+)
MVYLPTLFSAISCSWSRCFQLDSVVLGPLFHLQFPELNLRNDIRFFTLCRLPRLLLKWTRVLDLGEAPDGCRLVACGEDGGGGTGAVVLGSFDATR